MLLLLLLLWLQLLLLLLMLLLLSLLLLILLLMMIMKTKNIYVPFMYLLQEWPQVESTRLYTKYSARPTSLGHIPTVVERAYRSSVYGRPGVAYIDMPGDLLSDSIAEKDILLGPKVQRPPMSVPPKVLL